MDNTVLSLILLLSPFVGFLFNIFFGKSISKNVSGYIGTFTVIISFLVTIVLFLDLNATNKSSEIHLFQWFSLHDLRVDFGFLFDQLSVLWLLFVTGIGSLIHLYSISYNCDTMYKTDVVTKTIVATYTGMLPDDRPSIAYDGMHTLYFADGADGQGSYRCMLQPLFWLQHRFYTLCRIHN